MTGLRIVFAIMLAAMSLACTGAYAQTPPPGPNDALTGVIGNLNRGQVFEAIANLREILNRTPAFGPAHFYLATIYTEMGQYETAQGHLRQAILSDPDEAVYRHQTGIVQHRQLKWPDALQSFRHALELGMGPDEADTWREIGDVQIELFDPDAAMAAFETAVRLRPSDAASLLSLANLHLGRNNPVEAIRRLSRAIEMRPMLREAHAALGRAYMRTGDFPRAVATLTAALDLDPSNLESRYALAQALLSSGNVTEGRLQIETYRRLEEAVQQTDLLFDRAIESIDDGRWEEARTLLEEVRLQAPTFSRALHALGIVLNALNEPVAAVEVLNAALELNPLTATAYLDLGGAYIETGQIEEALDATERSLVLDEDNPDGFRQLGDVYRVLGRWAEAAAARQRANEMPPRPTPRAIDRLTNSGMDRRDAPE